MALALDASTPALFTSANDPWTTASFTPPNDSLLVVKIMADWFTGGTPLIAVTSTGLMFERIGRIGAASAGLTEIWIAKVGSNGGTSRTVSATTTLTDDSGGIKVEVWTGFNDADPIDAFVCGANNTTNSISPACVTTTDNAWLTGGGQDWQNLGAATSSDTNEHGEPGGVAILSVRKSAATSPAGSPTLNFDAAGASAPTWTWAIAALRADTADPSPIYKVADRGSAQNLTAQTSTAVDMAAAGSITTDNYLIARIALDNTGANGIATTLSVTDPRSNSWTVTAAGNADPGAAAAGSTCCIAYAKVANAYTNGDDITFNYGNSTTAKSIIIEEWFGIHKTTPLAVAATTTSGATATGSIARTPTAAGQLVYGALSYEGVAADQITSDPDQTDGSWLLTNQLATTSGTATSNQTTVGIYKRVTGTTAQTWNIVLPAARDWGAVMLVFDAEPAAGATVNGTADGAFGFTATSAGVDRALGTAAASFGFTGSAQGVDRALGAAVASLGFTAAASGIAGTPPVTGAASGLFGFTATALGIPRTRGAAVASFGFTASVAGVDRSIGAALASFGFTGSGSGIDRAVGIAASIFGFTAAIIGVPDVHGTAVGSFGFTGAAQGFAGTPPVTGAATGLFGFTATTQGQPRTPGVASAAFGFTATASGRPRVVSVAVAAFAFTGTTAGNPRVLGLAQATFTFTAAANGQGATVSAYSVAVVVDTRSGTGGIAAKRTSITSVSGQTSTSTVTERTTSN